MKGFAAVTPLERFSVLFCPHFSAAAINLSHLCVLGLLLIFSFHSDYEKLKNIAKKIYSKLSFLIQFWIPHSLVSK